MVVPLLILRLTLMCTQGPIGFHPYLELLLPPPENGVVSDSTTTAGTNVPSKVQRISLREVRPTDMPPRLVSISSHTRPLNTCSILCVAVAGECRGGPG